MRKILLSIGVLFFAILLLNIISAEISVSQPAGAYNLGDNLDIKATIKPVKDTTDFLNLDLICSNAYNFYKVPLTLSAFEEKTVETSLLLTNSLGIGKCVVKASYSNEDMTSQEFEISNKLNINLGTSEMIAEAGKQIDIRGTALRENNNKVDGYVELSIENSKVISIDRVVNGSFSASISMPENTKAGVYNLQVRVYEKYQQELTNEGIEYLKVYVKQTAKKIEIYFNQSITPGQKIRFKADILDQTGEIISGKIGAKIYDSKENLISTKVLESGVEENFLLELNSSSGYWKIYANAVNLTSEKMFYVEEMEKASFKVADGKLIIQNIGNVQYRKSVQISIGDYSEVKNVDLDIGEEMSFMLNAPEGDYEIKISDGSSDLSTKSFLTGNAVGINEIKQKSSFRYIIVWIFLILVAGLFVMTLFRKKTNYPGSSNAEKSTEKLIEKDSGVIKLSDAKFVFDTNVKQAEHTIVIDGRKETASLIAVKIRNLEGKRELLKNINNLISENKGAIYYSNDFIIGIFSSQITRTFSNEIIAVRTADKIDRMLKEYNKSKIKLDYGIAVNSGDLIVKKDNKLKFTSVGNTLPLTKKIADISSGEVLLSEVINSKVAGEVKTFRKSVQGLDVYNIKEISDRSKHDKFIYDFLARQKN